VSAWQILTKRKMSASLLASVSASLSAYLGMVPLDFSLVSGEMVPLDFSPVSGGMVPLDF